MDVEGDNKKVNVQSMVYKDRDSDSCITLYLFIAGKFEHNVEYSSEKWSVSTAEITNNFLFDIIERDGKRDLYGLLSDEQQKKFEAHTPRFIVTETIPSVGEGLESLLPHPTEVDGRKCFLYSHSQNDKLYIRVFEPASPSDTEFHAPNEEPLWTRLVGYHCSTTMQGCVFSLAVSLYVCPMVFCDFCSYFLM